MEQNAVLKNTLFLQIMHNLHYVTHMVTCLTINVIHRYKIGEKGMFICVNCRKLCQCSRMLKNSLNVSIFKKHANK